MDPSGGPGMEFPVLPSAFPRAKPSNLCWPPMPIPRHCVHSGEVRRERRSRSSHTLQRLAAPRAVCENISSALSHAARRLYKADSKPGPRLRATSAFITIAQTNSIGCFWIHAWFIPAPISARWIRRLEEAQVAKLNHICRKLDLQAGERLLDVGCGWGALICARCRSVWRRGDGLHPQPRPVRLRRRRS